MANSNDIKPEWKGIEKGTVLMILHRVIGHNHASKPDRFTMPVWKKHIVEATTKAFYFVDGVKYRKDQHGRNFGKSFVFVGESVRGFVAPNEATDMQLADEFSEKLRLINKATMSYRKVGELKDMELAFEAAQVLLSAFDFVDNAVEKQTDKVVEA